MREEEGTGACWGSKNNRKALIVVWLADLAHLPTRSAVVVAAAAVTHSS